MNVFLVAEADGQVGFGHLAEIRAVASALRQHGMAVTSIGIGPPVPGQPQVEWVPGYDAVMARIAAAAPRVIGWSVRTSRWRAAWPALEGSPARHLWIADLADDYPPVEALVVPALEPRWRPLHRGTRVLAGPAYFPLDLRGPRAVPPLAARSRDVLLTLGGADRTEASIRLAPALAGTKSTVVIGPAFRHDQELKRVAAGAGLDVAIAPDGLRELLLQHRLVVSAGGNTLFEAAAAGTPALVAWEDPHEEAQGRAFAQKGAARVIGRGADLDTNVVSGMVTSLLASKDLDVMSAAGRDLVDGRGADRIASLLVELAAGVAA